MLAAMDGVIAVLLAFLFLCIVFPSLVRNREQYYAALGITVGALLLQSLALAIGNERFIDVAAGLNGLLYVGVILLLILCTGGLTVRDLAGDMSRTIEVIRRGDTEKEILIPKSAQPPGAPPAATEPVAPSVREDRAPRYEINDEV